MALVLDTGPILALLNADDDHHDRCVDLVRDLGESLVVPAPTLVEVDYWVRTRMDVAAWRTFVEHLAAGAYRLEPVAEADVVRAAELEERHSDQFGLSRGRVGRLGRADCCLGASDSSVLLAIADPRDGQGAVEVVQLGGSDPAEGAQRCLGQGEKGVAAGCALLLQSLVGAD